MVKWGGVSACFQGVSLVLRWSWLAALPPQGQDRVRPKHHLIIPNGVIVSCYADTDVEDKACAAGPAKGQSAHTQAVELQLWDSSGRPEPQKGATTSEAAFKGGFGFTVRAAQFI